MNFVHKTLPTDMADVPVGSLIWYFGNAADVDNFLNFKIANGSNIPCGDYPLLEGIFTKKEYPRYIRGMYFSWTSENAEGYESLSAVPVDTWTASNKFVITPSDASSRTYKYYVVTKNSNKTVSITPFSSDETVNGDTVDDSIAALALSSNSTIPKNKLHILLNRNRIQYSILVDQPGTTDGEIHNAYWLEDSDTTKLQIISDITFYDDTFTMPVDSLIQRTVRTSLEEINSNDAYANYRSLFDEFSPMTVKCGINYEPIILEKGTYSNMFAAAYAKNNEEDTDKSLKYYVLPDLTDKRYVAGVAGTPGSLANNQIEAGLPNITGSFFGLIKGTVASDKYENPTGAFKKAYGDGPNGLDYATSTANTSKIFFDASKSSPIYNNNYNTVTPLSITAIPLIRVR